jgi:hypothetical protein
MTGVIEFGKVSPYFMEQLERKFPNAKRTVKFFGLLKAGQKITQKQARDELCAIGAVPMAVATCECCNREFWYFCPAEVYKAFTRTKET